MIKEGKVLGVPAQEDDLILNPLRFNKLVMNDVDLILIDVDPNDPLDFYRWNITKNSFRRNTQKNTSDSGLRVFIKDFNKVHPAKASPTDDKKK